MEKYSRFRDEGTGIAPFQRPRPNSQDLNLVQRVILFAISILSTTSAYLGLMVYFGLLRWIMPRFFARLILKYFVLVPLRLFYATLDYEGERRASVRKKSIRRAQRGDVIAMNFVSPLDPLVVESQLPSVEFVFPTADGKFEKVSTLTAVRRSLRLHKPAKSGVAIESLVAQATKRGAVVVVFVEGTTSNGRGLLTLKSLGTQDLAAVETKVYAAAIKYAPPSATAPTPRTLLGYLWGVSMASWWYMASVKVSGEPLAKATLTRNQLSKSIAGLGRLRILGDRLDVNAKEEYLIQTRKR